MALSSPPKGNIVDHEYEVERVGTKFAVSDGASPPSALAGDHLGAPVRQLVACLRHQ